MNQLSVLKGAAAMAGAALCMAAPFAAAAPLSINVAGCSALSFDGMGAGGIMNFTCTPGASSGSGPSSCSLSPSTGAVGTPISFVASCLAGTPATTYTWTVSPSTAATVPSSTVSGSQQITFNGPATLTMIPKDAAGNSGPSQQAVILSGSSPPPPPSGGTWAGTCPGFTKTLVHNFNWSTMGNMRVDTATIGGMGMNGVLVATFRTPNDPGHVGALLGVGVVQFPGTQSLVGRTVVVSEGAPACNLAIAPGWGTSGGSIVSFNLAYGLPYGSLGVLKPNTNYFVTVANFASGRGGSGPTCTTGKCDLRLEINKPAGL